MIKFIIPFIIFNPYIITFILSLFYSLILLDQNFINIFLNLFIFIIHINFSIIKLIIRYFIIINFIFRFHFYIIHELYYFLNLLN